MKKTIILLCWILGGVCVMAQNTHPVLNVTGIHVEQTGNEMNIQFTLHATKGAVKKDDQLVIYPVIRSLTDSLELAPIYIQGKRAGISEKRHLLASRQLKTDKPFLIKEKGKVSYETNVSYQEWMKGGALILRGILIGCCEATEVIIGKVAGNLLADIKKERVTTEEAVKQPNDPTTAEKLADEYPFLAPVSEYDPNRMVRRAGALTIYFRQGKHVIERDYMNNRQSLLELTTAIRTINESSDSRVAYILIAGFASPEGTAAINERLAGNRAWALKNFVMGYGAVKENEIRVYNGSVDWEGLRKLVEESDMYDRNRVLEIIDNTSVWNSYQQEGRLKRLMNLNGGRTYRYMLEHLFPLLRNAAYIKVYYENK